MSWFQKLIDDIRGKTQARRVEDTMNKIPGMLEEKLNPYIQRGEEQYGQLSQAYGDMMKDPAAFLENIMQSYQPSESFQRRRDDALRAARNSAAAGGMSGSLSNQEDQFKLANQLMGDDMQQWLQNVLGIQGAGMGGQQNFYDQGYAASRGLASDLANVLGSKAQFQSQRKSILDSLLPAVGQGVGGGLGKWVTGG